MKKISLIVLLFSITITSFAGIKKIKEQLSNCETVLKACLSTKELTTDTLFVYIINESVSVAKAKEKTKRKELTIDLKKKNQERRQNKTKERNKTKRNIIFQFFTSLKFFFASLSLGEILGGGAGISGLLGIVGVAFEKFQPITMFFKLFSKK